MGNSVAYNERKVLNINTIIPYAVFSKLTFQFDLMISCVSCICKESRIIPFSLFSNSHTFSVQASLCESLITLIANHQLLKKQSYRQLFILDLVGSILLE